MFSMLRFQQVTLACVLILNCWGAYAGGDIEGAAFKEIVTRRQGVEKILRALSKNEKKALSRFKKVALFFQRLVKQGLTLEQGVKRATARLEDARSIPSGNPDQNAQRDAAIEAHSKRRATLIGEIGALAKAGERVEAEFQKVSQRMAECVATRKQHIKEVVTAEHKLVRLGRKSLFSLPGSCGSSFNKAQLGLAVDFFKDEGERLSSKTAVIAVESGQSWLLFDKVRSKVFALSMEKERIELVGRLLREARPRPWKAEDKKMAAVRKAVLAPLAKLLSSSKGKQLVDAFAGLVKRNTARK
jgi:hypothetical protein